MDPRTNLRQLVTQPPQGQAQPQPPEEGGAIDWIANHTYRPVVNWYNADLADADKGYAQGFKAIKTHQDPSKTGY